MPSARVLIVPVTPFQQNCTSLWCEATKHTVVIDPGRDLPMIEQAIARVKVIIRQIWLTHGHIDHAGGAAALKELLGVPIEGPHRGDLFLLEGGGDAIEHALARRRNRSEVGVERHAGLGDRGLHFRYVHRVAPDYQLIVTRGYEIDGVAWGMPEARYRRDARKHFALR